MRDETVTGMVMFVLSPEVPVSIYPHEVLLHLCTSLSDVSVSLKFLCINPEP